MRTYLPILEGVRIIERKDSRGQKMIVTKRDGLIRNDSTQAL